MNISRYSRLKAISRKSGVRDMGTGKASNISRKGATPLAISARVRKNREGEKNFFFIVRLLVKYVR